MILNQNRSIGTTNVLFKTELTKNIDQVVEWLNQQQIEKLCLTGGNAGVIAENINIPAQVL